MAQFSVDEINGLKNFIEESSVITKLNSFNIIVNDNLDILWSLVKKRDYNPEDYLSDEILLLFRTDFYQDILWNTISFTPTASPKSVQINLSLSDHSFKSDLEEIMKIVSLPLLVKIGRLHKTM